MPAPRVLRYAKHQTWFLPSAATEVWEPVWMGHRLLTRFALMLESITDVELTPIRCLILAHIGRKSGLGVHASRLARELAVPRATLRYHLDALFDARLIGSIGPGPHDRRRRRLVLTVRGASALDRASELLVDLTAGGDWPAGAPRRNHWNLRRISDDSRLNGYLKDDPFPGVSSLTPPPTRKRPSRRVRGVTTEP